jgi:predicted Zn-dependent protease
MMRKFNLVFLAVFLTIATALGGGLYLLHRIQIRRKATDLLDRARRAQIDNNIDETQKALERYLQIRNDDRAAWVWYAQVMDRLDSGHHRRWQVFLLYEQALRHSPGDLKLERRCGEIALELGQNNYAQPYLMKLYDRVTKDASVHPAAEELAELEELLGECSRGLGSLDQAEQWFRKSLRHDPHRVSCYDRLARLQRTDLLQAEPADKTIQELVEQNPRAARAYLFRWRYAADFWPAADANDLAAALRLAPDDAEVILAAAVASEKKGDSNAARAYWEQGCRLHPDNISLVLGLSRVEAREGHLDRAEGVLRQAYDASPSTDLALALADTLISQDKIDGSHEAAEYIADFERAGLGNSYAAFLKARVLFRRKKWAEAIPQIESAMAALQRIPQLALSLDLMLAECHGNLGSDERRLDCLQRAAESGEASDSVRIELARAQAAAGKLEKAISILAPLARSRPELRLDLARLSIEQAIRQPVKLQNWPDVERRLLEAERALPRAVEPLVLLRVDLLAAHGRLEDARLHVSAALAKDPRNLHFRLALARITQRQGDSRAALQMIDRAESDLGPSTELTCARLEYWERERGDAAKAAVAKLAATRQQILSSDRPAFLERLVTAEIRIGQAPSARAHLRELALLEPANLHVLLGLFDLAMQAGDRADGQGIVARMRAIEGEQGTFWRLAQASSLLDLARRNRGTEAKAARILADEIAERRPDWWGTALVRGEIAEIGGRTEEAIAQYTLAVERGNAQPKVAQRLVGLLNQNNQLDQIEPLLEKVAAPAQKAGPEEVAWANRTRAQAILKSGRPAALDQALALVEQNLKNDPSSPADRRLKALLLARRTSRRVDAIKLLEPLDEAHQLSVAEQFILAQLYLAERMVDKYGGQMLKILAAGSKNPQHLIHFTDFLIGRHELDQAERRLEELKAVAPQSLGLLELRARYLQARNHDGEVRELLLDRGQRNPDELGVVANLLERFGFAREAESAYKAFVTRDPGQPERALDLATFLARQNRPREATAILERAWKTCRPELVATSALPVYVAPSAGEDLKREVEAWVSAAMQKSPSAAAALRPKLAGIYRRQGRYDEAETILRQILRGDPDHVEALNDLAWLLVLRDQGRIEEALDLIGRAIEKAGRISSLVDTRAVALIRAGQLDRAAQELLDARAADPKNLSLALHLAWARQQAGKTEEARQALKQAEALGLKPETRDPLERAIIARLRSQLAADERPAPNRG